MAPAPVVFNPHEDQAAHQLHMSREGYVQPVYVLRMVVQTLRASWVQVSWFCWSSCECSICLGVAFLPLILTLEFPNSIHCWAVGVFICVTLLVAGASQRTAMLDSCLQA